MYTKDKEMKGMRIISILFSVIGSFEVTMSVWNIISLISHYRDDLATVLYARSTPQSVSSIIVGTILLIIAAKLKGMVEDANFFSGYFEGNLEGCVSCRDLADVTGREEAGIYKKLQLLQKYCMKNFKLQEENGRGQVVLSSKRYLCECKNCGAPIEKRIYFTGTCAYCGSSDLFAKVLADNRFYSISTDVSKGVKKPAFYTASNLQNKRAVSIIILCLGIWMMVSMGAYALDCGAKYNDEEYVREMMLSGERYIVSFDAFKKDMIDGILWGIAIILAVIPAVIGRVKGLSFLSAADTCSKFFAGYKTPFVKAEDLPAADGRRAGKKVKMKAVRGALKKRYLRNCTLEKHGDVLMIALAKSIVKDKCPSCNGPIAGAVDEHYKCAYCNNMIMNVVRKK